MIDAERETPITLEAARQLLPDIRGNGRPHYRTIWRWATKGVRGVRLETTCFGHQRMTTREAIGRFLRTLTAIRDEAVLPAEVRRSARHRRERSYQAAREELAAEHGI